MPKSSKGTTSPSSRETTPCTGRTHGPSPLPHRMVFAQEMPARMRGTISASTSRVGRPSIFLVRGEVLPLVGLHPRELVRLEAACAWRSRGGPGSARRRRRRRRARAGPSPAPRGRARARAGPRGSAPAGAACSRSPPRAARCRAPSAPRRRGSPARALPAPACGPGSPRSAPPTGIRPETHRAASATSVINTPRAPRPGAAGSPASRGSRRRPWRSRPRGRAPASSARPAR